MQHGIRNPNFRVALGGIQNCDNDILTSVMFDVRRSARDCCPDAAGEDMSEDVRLGGGGEIRAKEAGVRPDDISCR